MADMDDGYVSTIQSLMSDKIMNGLIQTDKMSFVFILRSRLRRQNARLRK